MKTHTKEKSCGCAGCLLASILGEEEIETKQLLEGVLMAMGLIKEAFKLKIPEPLNPETALCELAGFATALTMLDTPAFQTSKVSMIRGFYQEKLAVLLLSQVGQEVLRKAGIGVVEVTESLNPTIH